MSWIDTAGQLSRTGPGEVLHARRTLRDLARPARALHTVARPCGTPGHVGCAFADHQHGAALCAVVPRLACLDVGAPGRVDDPARELVAALAASGDAVRWCRTTAHTTGDCWFGGLETGGCTEVLRLVLRLA